jgi:hypothetical protein
MWHAINAPHRDGAHPHHPACRETATTRLNVPVPLPVCVVIFHHFHNSGCERAALASSPSDFASPDP